MNEPSDVGEFYSGKTIFITGSSGLIGKVLIWKLLHSCPKLNTIYVLIRPKRGKEARSRLEEILQSPVFNSFKRENPKLLEKLRIVVGDIGANNLGLSKEDESKLIREVNIVFHIAAILKFDANLRDAININTEGTLRLLQLCIKMDNLQALIHTSTAYCHCDIPIMEEKIYSTSECPYDVIKLTQWMSPEILQSITNKLIKPHPNTYTYSKRLAENIIADFFPRLPIAVARPSIIVSAWEEPIPGWIDSMNGPTGILIAAGKGIIRTMYCNGTYNADLNPVDIVCNGLIATAWKTATLDRPKEIPVYNLTQAEIEPMTWQEIINLTKKFGRKYPFEVMLWYPDDKKIFKLTLEGLDRETFTANSVLASRQYVLKEDPSTIPRSIIRLKILYVIDRVAKLLFIFFATWIVMKIFRLIFVTE